MEPLEPKRKLAIGGVIVFSGLLVAAGYKLNSPAEASDPHKPIPTEESTTTVATTVAPTATGQLLMCKPVVLS